jgi:uncharacterized protein YndB with AHSA1/START domain
MHLVTERLTKTLERMIAAPRERVWELWTTAEGIAAWWAPDGFRADVQQLDLREGGELVYSFTAIAPEQIAFLQQYGLPLVNQARKTFTEIDAPNRLAYESVIDFVPGHEPYQELTVIEFAVADGGTAVTMRMEPLHDEVWTERLLTGRANELENLARLVSSQES